MRTSLFLALAVLPGFLVGCAYTSVSTSRSYSDADLRAVTNVVKSGALPADLELLEVNNRSGLIRVVGTDAGVAEWTWKLTIRALDDEAVQQAANTFDCKVDREGNRLRLALSFPETEGPLRFESELEIRAPKSDQSGAIQLQATSSQLTNLVARSSYAALDVQLPAALKPAIQARTSYADIESDWPVLLRSREENPFAEVDPATPRIILENQSGRIRITRE